NDSSPGAKMKNTLVLLLIIVALNTPSTSQELRTKYGQSDVERFRVRPDLDATVQYGSDRCLCQVLLGAPVSVTEVQSLTTYVSSDEMQAVTDELAPPQGR